MIQECFKPPYLEDYSNAQFSRKNSFYVLECTWRHAGIEFLSKGGKINAYRNIRLIKKRKLLGNKMQNFHTVMRPIHMQLKKRRIDLKNICRKYCNDIYHIILIWYRQIGFFGLLKNLELRFKNIKEGIMSNHNVRFGERLIQKVKIFEY